MLTHLQIHDYALVTQLELECLSGLTVITGETGAGKSIMLGALGLALGDRADADKVRIGAERADIHAHFNIEKLTFAQKWLTENDLSNAQECILRRVITKDGRSRAYINGRTVTLQQLKCFGEMLIDIHSQHEHQSLLKPVTHRRLLDEFGNLQRLATNVRTAFSRWYKANSQLTNLHTQSAEINARFQLIRYQVEELDQLNLEENELHELEQEQKTLANIESIQQHCQQVTDLCSHDDGLLDRLNSAIHLLRTLPDKSHDVKNAEDLLHQAFINIQEAQHDLDKQLDTDNDNAARLPEIEKRLSTIYTISRKHRIAPEELYTLHQSLSAELQASQSGDDIIEELEIESAQALKEYKKYALTLSKERQKAAKKLTLRVNEKLKQLAMGHAEFAISFADIEAPADKHGSEFIQFLISTNPNQAPKPLAKIASGGELSRISLSIQVVTAQTSTIPTLIFDEVDAGIGGTTGDEVGRMLRELGENGQVFCVTHLAQVASKAQNHLLVEKTISKKDVNSTLTPLHDSSVVQEIARMMGGSIDSKQSLEHAKEMLALAKTS